MATIKPAVNTTLKDGIHMFNIIEDLMIETMIEIFGPDIAIIGVEEVEDTAYVPYPFGIDLEED